MANFLTGAIKSLNEKKHQLQKREQATNHRIANILTEDSSFSIKEAYKTTRTNLIFALGGKEECKRIILTSAEPGEGKTTTSLNLAISFAETGAKVLIIDADLRKPRIHRYLHFDKKNGLSDLLIGSVAIEKSIKHHDKFNLDFLPAGQIPPNPVELLSSDKMRQLLDKLGENYDYIFIDSPPVTVVSDASAMASMVDGYIVVVRHNYTIHELLDRTRSALLFADGKILGYIMNDIKPLGGLPYNQYGAYSAKYGSAYYKYRYSYRNNYKYEYSDKSGEFSYADPPEIEEKTKKDNKDNTEKNKK